MLQPPAELRYKPTPPAPYLHLPTVTVLSIFQKAIATFPSHYQVFGVGQVEETHATSLLEVALQLPLAAGAEDTWEGVSVWETDGEGWEPGHVGPGEGGKPQSELGNKDKQQTPSSSCIHTTISHPNLHW